jgi:trans-aconitate methyltransferase
MPVTDRKAHWDDVYRERGEGGVSWFQERPERSLSLIASAGLEKSAPIIDAGAGASRLVDGLLDAGYTDLTALDVSREAQRIAQRRLARRAGLVHWIEGDVLDFKPQRRYALWHDRAVFHFLTERADRDRYAAVLSAALAPRGCALIAAFAPDGPDKCSGLPVQRYDAASLAAALGPGFSPLREEAEPHGTPWGSVQKFRYVLLRKD